MTNNRDEEALSWGDEGDPTHIEAPQQQTAAGEEPRGDTPTLRRGVAERRERARSEQEADAVAGARANARAHRSADRALATDVDADAAVAPAPMGSVALVILGILGGVYLLYTVGWITSANRNIAVPVGALDILMAQLREYLSIAAPALWFGATLLLTRGSKTILRVLWLLLGVIVLLPLPFVLGY